MPSIAPSSSSFSGGSVWHPAAYSAAEAVPREERSVRSREGFELEDLQGHWFRSCHGKGKQNLEQQQQQQQQHTSLSHSSSSRLVVVVMRSTHGSCPSSVCSTSPSLHQSPCTISTRLLSPDIYSPSRKVCLHLVYTIKININILTFRCPRLVQSHYHSYTGAV